MRTLAALVLLLAACAADPVLAPRDCTPGTTTSCACPGASGVQTCTAAGTVGACVCADGGSAADVVEDRPAPRDVVECSPGASEQCTCGGSGALGARTCEASARWSGCRCGVVDAGADVVDVVIVADVAAVDANRCPSGPVATCDGRRVNVHSGERDGGAVLHCGQCGNTCPVPDGSSWRHTSAYCEMCRCIVDCAGDYRDCDGNPANGCEALFGDINNCGACGRRCAAGQRCVGVPARCEF